MKINEVITESQQLNEFEGLHDFGTFVKSVWSNIGKKGLSWKDIKARADSDRNIQFGAKDLITRWKQVKYSLIQSKKGQDPSPQELTLLFEKLIASFGSDPEELHDEVTRIINMGDRLDNRQAWKLATNIILNAVANEIQRMTGQDIEPEAEKAEEPPKEQTRKFDYGSSLPAEILKSNDPDNYHPVIIINDPDNHIRPDNVTPDGKPRRYIKWNGDWYSDEQSEGVDITIPPAKKVIQPTKDVATYNTQIYIADYLERQKKLKQFQNHPKSPGAPGEDVQLVGIEKIDANNFRLPSSDEIAAWKTRTGRTE